MLRTETEAAVPPVPERMVREAKRGPAERPRFPQPVRFNFKKYYRRSDLDHFKLALEAFALGRPAPPKPPPPPGDPLVPHVAVAEEFGVDPRSVDRWVAAAREAREAA